jgi:hypothetical protein
LAWPGHRAPRRGSPKRSEIQGRLGPPLLASSTASETCVAIQAERGLAVHLHGHDQGSTAGRRHLRYGEQPAGHRERLAAAAEGERASRPSLAQGSRTSGSPRSASSRPLHARRPRVGVPERAPSHGMGPRGSRAPRRARARGRTPGARSAICPARGAGPRAARGQAQRVLDGRIGPRCPRRGSWRRRVRTILGERRPGDSGSPRGATPHREGEAASGAPGERLEPSFFVAR